MRFISEAISPEDRIYISKLNDEFFPLQSFSNPCLDVKWMACEGTVRLYIIDRTAGPGWQGNSLAICSGVDNYRISVTWGEIGPFAFAKVHAQAYIYYRERLLESLSADVRELADAAVFASCEHEHSRWDVDNPFVGVEITYPTEGAGK